MVFGELKDMTPAAVAGVNEGLQKTVAVCASGKVIGFVAVLVSYTGESMTADMIAAGAFGDATKFIMLSGLESAEAFVENDGAFPAPQDKRSLS